MKLSEAIRLGAMLRPQTRFHLKDQVGTCAMGAALEAVGSGMEGGSFNRLWPWAKTTAVEIPCNFIPQGYPYTVERVIADLNDLYGWTRERIADWVATVEPKEDAESTTCKDQPGAEAATEGPDVAALCIRVD